MGAAAAVRSDSPPREAFSEAVSAAVCGQSIVRVPFSAKTEKIDSALRIKKAERENLALLYRLAVQDNDQSYASRRLEKLLAQKYPNHLQNLKPFPVSISSLAERDLSRQKPSRKLNLFLEPFRKQKRSP